MPEDVERVRETLGPTAARAYDARFDPYHLTLASPEVSVE